MKKTELIAVLAALAREAGLEVRLAGSGARSHLESPAASGVCRVRGTPWVILSSRDPLEIQIEVLVKALREHAAALLEERYLPPAVRERVGG